LKLYLNIIKGDGPSHHSTTRSTLLNIANPSAHKMTVNQKLNALVNEYERTHPRSKAAYTKAKNVLPAGSTRSVLVSEPFPLVIKSAQGAHFTTIDGTTFEDFVSDFSAGIYGHSHPVVHHAVQEALATGFSLGGITQKETELAEILTTRFPSFEKVRFCNSGTEANTFALATAVAYTQRKKVGENPL
jgi:glutamate-1-semialdehyde 2,1-aminomutase